MHRTVSSYVAFVSLVCLIPRVSLSEDLQTTPPELCTRPAATMDLEAGFLTPPDDARPRVYWWWLNSQVTKEAITRDLEEMQAKGIGGALLFDAGGGKDVPPGPAFLSDEWRELFRHAVREAHRCGIELSVNLCSGWDCGGPWITPEYACRRLSTSRLTLEGPQSFDGDIPLPPGDDYRDVAVVAFPVSPDHRELPAPQVRASSSQGNHPISGLDDGRSNTFWVSNGLHPGDGPTEEKPEWLLFEFPEAVPLSMMRIVPRASFGPHRLAVQVADADGAFRTVAEHVFEDPADASPVLIRFPEVTTRQARLWITSAYSFGSSEKSWNVQICEVGFDETPPWEDWAVRAAVARGAYETALPPKFGQSFIDPLEGTAFHDPKQVVSAGDVVVLTEKLDDDGRLHWQAPQGRWTVVRLGHVAAGYQTHSSSEGGRGLEVDWLSAAAMDFHFAATAEKLLEDAGPLAGKTLRFFHDDSWEVGVPNWTPEFLDTFRRNRGYDPMPYLPVLAKQVVDSPEISERFLYDYRKTIADCFVDGHYGRFRDLCHRNGVLLHTEGGGPATLIAPMDVLGNLGANDVPMGEFWQYGEWTNGGQNLVGKQTACAAHIYGKRFVAAEAFTSMKQPHWHEGPAEMKPIADIAFCEGINRCFHHTFTCSPQPFGRPGIEYFAGTHFNPNITWWQQAGALEQYIARCQFLLSQGLFVADVCYYYGDNVPNFVTPKHTDPALGPGYDYDVCNTDVLLNRMTLANGRIVLPDGMNYRLLALPDRETMPLEVVRKLAELVRAGATIVGPRPKRAPGLQGYPQYDEELQKLAGQLWGDCDGDKVTEHRFGEGRVIWGRTLREVLQGDGIAPDFTYSAEADDASLDFIHRTVQGAEIYFVANRNDRQDQVRCCFRITGRQPELWDPVWGTTIEAKAFRQTDDQTIVPLRFPPHGSLFVVFRKPIAGNASGPADCNWPDEGDSYELTGPWTVRFDPKWGGPDSVVFNCLTDWTTRPEPGIRHYSGAATYTQTFDLPDGMQTDGGRIVLDLGVVKNVAEVRLNGKQLGVVWTAPWRVDISDAAKPVGNRLDITVVNLWPNRLIGDSGLPAEKRFTRTNVTGFTWDGKAPISPDLPLLPSGLLGPVTVKQVKPR